MTITLRLRKDSIFAVLILLFKTSVDHKFSMGLSSGEFPGHGHNISMFCSPSHLVITFALRQGVPSCWKRHCSSPNCSWMVGRSCSWRMFLCHSQNFCLLKLIQLWDRGTTRAELAQEWQQAGVSASAHPPRATSPNHPRTVW